MLTAMPVHVSVSPDLVQAQNRQQDRPCITEPVTADLERIQHALSHPADMNGLQGRVKITSYDQRPIRILCDQFFESVECRLPGFSRIGIHVQNDQCQRLFVHQQVKDPVPADAGDDSGFTAKLLSTQHQNHP